ncbi:hypothetical protein [Bdellovibrio sp. HCB337]|uniref:hypothetical protein n=1 Tax=Bdellovibrio sp. HCB337 TaxID=3394358 RepID=UPI0039A57A54
MQLLCDEMKVQKDFLLPLPTGAQPSDLEKIRDVFLENQSAILSLVIQKKDLLSKKDYAYLVKSISTVTMGSFEDSAVQKLFFGACNRPNAIYVPSMNKVFVCPSLARFPESTLRQILAHELGHSVQRLQKVIPCFQEYTKAQSREAFADWVASKVLSESIRLEADPAVAKKNAFESQLLFLSLACETQPKNKPDWSPSHPSLQSRIEGIFLSQPAFQKALHCEAKSPKVCG